MNGESIKNFKMLVRKTRLRKRQRTVLPPLSSSINPVPFTWQS